MTDFELLEKEFYKKTINWEIVESLIKCLSPTINDKIDDYGDPSCALALLIQYFNHNGEDLVKLFKLFIENGFDPKANDYNNGYSVLCALAYTTDDHYILDAAKLLLDRGAKVDEGTFESISWQLGDWVVGDCDFANIITTYCVLAKQVMQVEEYQDVECWDFVKRKRLDKIERFNITDKETGEQRENYALWFDGIPLIINEYTESYVNPYVLNKAFNRIDVSEKFSEIIGRKMKTVHYIDAGTVHISFFNNCKLAFASNDNKLCLKSLLIKGKATIHVGEKIHSFKVMSGMRYAECVRIYRQNTVFLTTENNDLQITNNNVYGDNYFAINKVTPEFIKNATENVSVTNGKICEYFYHTKNETEISGICIECDKGYLYIRSSSFRELEIFLSSKRFNVQEFVSCEAYNKEIFGNLKRIDAFKIMNKQES
ncbi:MAG: hypothetical protein PUE46_01790 [Eubacteriales bacterium]|nr:hypothetical protein [Eubacteriales bacterium]